MDRKLSKQLNLASIFSILCKFSTKIGCGEEENRMVAKKARPLQDNQNLEALVESHY